MMKLLGAALFAAMPIAVSAGAFGFSAHTGTTTNFEGREVPEVVLVIDAGQKRLDRGQLQAAVRNELKKHGISPDQVAVQSVATAAIQFAKVQDMGMQSMCYERWCARVSVEGGEY